MRSIVVEMEKSWPTNRAITLVFYGHSVPAGYFKTPVVDTFHAYPHLLHRALKEKFPQAVINIIVTAIGGEDSVSGEKRFERDVLPHKPDVLLIDYGLNDRRPGLGKAKTGWTSMIQKAQVAGIKIILLTPTPDSNARMDDPNDPLNQHAEQIRQLALDFHIALVDSLALFKIEVMKGTPLQDLLSQSNHPNARGHQLVADALQKWFPPSP